MKRKLFLLLAILSLVCLVFTACSGKDEPIVSGRTPVGIEVVSQPTKVNYTVGDTLDTSGLTIKVKFDDDTYSDEISVTEIQLSADLTTVGEKTVTVKYTLDGTEYQATFTVNVAAAIEEHTHSFDSVWQKDAQNHWKTCTCGEVGNTAAHTYGNWVSVTAATCTTVGTENRVCSVCGFTETRDTAVLGHSLVHHDAKPATCTESGYDAYDTCSRCDHTTYAAVTALGHALVHHDAKPATCTEAGYDAYDTCSRCDHTTYTAVTALGHTGGTATCTAQAVCTRCSTAYGELLPHEYFDFHCVDCGAEQDLPASEGLSYVLNAAKDGYIVISADACIDDVVVIPSEYRGLPVTEIGENAFCYSSITAVKIPSSVKTISYAAFADCFNLTAVTIPSSVTYMVEDAFDDCLKLNFVTNLSEIFFPPINYYEDYTSFEISEQRYSLTAPFALTIATDDNGVVTYNDRGKISIIDYVGTAADLDLSGYTDIHSVGPCAFAYSETLQSLILPNGLYEIHARAFYGCVNLHYLEIPASVEYVEGDQSVADCLKLVNLRNLSDKDVLDSNREYDYCQEVTTASGEFLNNVVTDGNGVQTVVIDGVKYLFGYVGTDSTLDLSAYTDCTAVYNGAFSGSKIESLILPENIKYLENHISGERSRLTSIVLPKNMQSFEGSALRNCTRLSSITLPAGNRFYRVEGNCVIDVMNNAVVFGCRTSVIPEGVEIISNFAFCNCVGLTEIAIPSSVKEIKDDAFTGCVNLTKVTLPKNLDEIGEDAFCNCYSLTTFEIEQGNDTFKFENGCLYNTEHGNTIFATLDADTLPEGVKIVSPNTFLKYTRAETVTLPYGVLELCENAFYKCIVLERVVLPKSLQDISLYTFKRCNNCSLYYEGDVFQWMDAGFDDIEIEIFQNALLYSEEFYEGDWCYLEGEIHVWKACSSHEFSPATCELPETCTLCGYMQDAPLGHEGGTATCTAKAVCTRCGKEYGLLAKHDFTDGVCVACGYTCTHVYDGALTCIDHACELCGKTIEATAEHDYVEDATIVFDNGIEEVSGLTITNDEIFPFEYDGKQIISTNHKALSTSTLTITARFKLNLCFELLAISEGDCDYVTCYVNGVEYGSWSGMLDEDDADYIDIKLLAGDVLTISYSKDYSESYGNDAVVIKNLIVSSRIQPRHACSPAECTLCGTARSSAEHDFDEATCTHVSTCKVCGVDGDFLPHTYGEYVSDDNATCTQDGTEHADCTVCGHRDTRDVAGSALGHTGGTATCTAQAACTRCGEKYGDMLPHTYGDYVFDNNATCTADGTEHALCTGCNDCDTRIATGTALGHTGGTATCSKKAVCTRCGEEYGDTLPHTFDEDYNCTVCGAFKGSTANMTFTLNAAGDAYVLTKYTTQISQDLYLPTVYNGLPVTEIGDSAFYNVNCTGIFIPSSITKIGAKAFQFCDNLTEIRLPNNLVSIGDMAFDYCIWLLSITIPASVQTISKDAFNRCERLIYVTNLSALTLSFNKDVVGREVRTSTETAFTTTITKDENGIEILQTGNDKYIYSYTGPADVDLTAYTDVKGLYTRAFDGAQITSLKLSDSMTELMEHSISYCYELEYVVLPAGFTTVQTYVFYYCKSGMIVYFKGTSAQMTAVGFDTDDVTPYYYSETAAEGAWHYVEGEPTVWQL